LNPFSVWNGTVTKSVSYSKHSPNNEDLKKILASELEDNIGMCQQGNLTRLCNILSGYLDEPAKFISAMIVGIIISLTIYGLLVDELLVPLWKQTESHLSSDFIPYFQYIRILFDLIIATAAGQTSLTRKGSSPRPHRALWRQNGKLPTKRVATFQLF
jgi:hypothetical protein